MRAGLIGWVTGHVISHPIIVFGAAFSVPVPKISARLELGGVGRLGFLERIGAKRTDTTVCILKARGVRKGACRRRLRCAGRRLQLRGILRRGMGLCSSRAFCGGVCGPCCSFGACVGGAATTRPQNSRAYRIFDAESWGGMATRHMPTPWRRLYGAPAWGIGAILPVPH